MRVLLSITRRVPAGEQAAYEGAWRRLRQAAGDAGVHAWRFRAAAASEPTPYLEFLEWRADGSAPTASGSLAAALAELEDAFPGEGGMWHEVTGESLQEGGP